MMSKKVDIPFSTQARKTIRIAAGHLDETASDFIRDTIRDKLKKLDISNFKDLTHEK